MNSFSKWLIIGGAVLIVIGIVWHFAGRFLPLGRLPGDIVVEKENVRFYFPIVTCIIISIVASLLMQLFRLWK
jgi:hypothetical protein